VKLQGLEPFFLFFFFLSLENGKERGFATAKSRSKKGAADEIEEGQLLEEVFPAIRAYAVSPFDETIELIVKTTLKRGYRNPLLLFDRVKNHECCGSSNQWRIMVLFHLL